MRIACHIIRKEIKGEKKYAIHTTGANELKKLVEKKFDTSRSTIYMPASYDLLELLFTQIRPYNLAHFLDIGCGKGRAMCVAAHFNFTKLTGIDFSKEFCVQAKENLTTTKRNFPSLTYNIINNDILYYAEIPTDADCLFLFNPFDEYIMNSVIQKIDTSLEKSPRDIFIMYLNPLHKTAFLKNGYREIYYTKKLTYLEGSILKKARAKPGLQ